MYRKPWKGTAHENASENRFGGCRLSACVTTLIAKAGGKTQTLYAVTDLGPGYASKVSNPDASGTFLVVGNTPDPDGNELATVWTVSSDGTVVDVFTYDMLPPGSVATDVNDHGMVVGLDQGAFNGAFVDVPGVGVEFLPGALQAFGVNNEGVVVGIVSDPSAPFGESGAVWYVDDATGAITGPVLTTIGPGVTFLPFDINDEGTMCGVIFAAGSSNTPAATAEFDSAGQLQVQNLGVLNPGDTFSEAFSINSDGLIAGISSGTGDSAVLWDPSQPNTPTSLGDFGGGESQALDINDDGQVVGYSLTKNQKSALGFIWQNGKMVNLNKVLTSHRSHTIEIANGINNTGHIVGSMESGDAFVLTPQ